jgi:hypothetical protein
MPARLAGQGPIRRPLTSRANYRGLHLALELAGEDALDLRVHSRRGHSSWRSPADSPLWFSGPLAWPNRRPRFWAERPPLRGAANGPPGDTTSRSRVCLRPRTSASRRQTLTGRPLTTPNFKRFTARLLRLCLPRTFQPPFKPTERLPPGYRIRDSPVTSQETGGERGLRGCAQTRSHLGGHPCPVVQYSSKRFSACRS